METAFRSEYAEAEKQLKELNFQKAGLCGLVSQQ
jgi:hypothetical protein